MAWTPTEVPGGGERLLATSIAWSRGWSARGEGRELPALTVNGAFLGVRLPGGVSRVELRFLPPGFVAGCIAFAVAAVAVLLLISPPSWWQGNVGAGLVPTRAAAKRKPLPPPGRGQAPPLH